MANRSFRSYLKRNRTTLELDLIKKAQWWKFSPIIFSQYKVMLPAIEPHISGRGIDLGSGNAPYRSNLEMHLTGYDRVDLFSADPSINYRLDIENLDGIRDGSYDTAFLIEVLEHIRHPWLALKEINRILKIDGKLIITAPHISRLHDEPYDFFRFTCHGLQSLLDDNGFAVLELIPKGGMLLFWGHQVSVFFLSMVWPIPVLRDIVFFVNYWCNTRFLFTLDRLLFKRPLFPVGYVVIARKT